MSRLMRLLLDNRSTPVVLSAQPSADESVDVLMYGVIAADLDEAQLWGGIAPEQVVQMLGDLRGKPLRLRINSPGGSVFGGRAIEQALREHDAPVVAQIDGLAASAATVVAMGAQEVRMSAGAMWMVHKSWSMSIGNANDMLETAALLEKIDATLARTYSQRTGKALDVIESWMEQETWFDAGEAVDAGFADAVIEHDVKGRAGARAWNIGAYTNAPKDLLCGDATQSEDAKIEQRRRRAALLRPLSACLADLCLQPSVRIIEKRAEAKGGK